MIKIRKGGISRVCSQKAYYDKYKAQGYSIVEEKEPEEEPQEEMTKKQIMEALDEKGISYDARKKKADLAELLGVG